MHKQRPALHCGAHQSGKAISFSVRSGLLALVAIAPTVSLGYAATPYDGRWSLSITTTRGASDAYNFAVDIQNGRVSFPGLVRANGRVIGKGNVRVFVATMGKSASGSGKLSLSSGSGSWSGRSGDDRCVGRWTAQRG
jgi:hypothetical protein